MDLREKAKKLLENEKPDNSSLLNKDLEKVVEELRIYQFELELQNQELRETQLKLEESHKRYEELFHKAPLGYLTLDEEFTITNINQTGQHMLGMEKSLKGSKFFSLVHPDFQDQFYLCFKGVLKSGKEIKRDIRLQKGHNQWFYARLSCKHYLDEKQKPNIRMTLDDVSLEKKLEAKIVREKEKLKESESRFRQIVERSSDVFYYQNMQSAQFEYVSPNISHLLGISDQEFLHLNLAEQKSKVHPEDLPIVVSFRDDLIKADEEGKANLERKFRLKHKDGHYVWLHGNYALLRDENGKPVSVVGSLHDISELTNNAIELKAAKEKAEENDRLKSAFLANMSHEIRTPMNGIMGFAQLLREKDRSEEDREKYLAIIEKSGKRMLNLINDLINISRIEAGQMTVEKDRFEINELMDELYHFFKAETNKKAIQFQMHKGQPNKNFMLNTDREKLFAVLTNLIKNAIKYTEKGSISFGYEIREKHLEFFIKDTGIGISKKHQEVVFDRFTREHYRADSPYEGSGLGLAISAAFVKMMQGKIWFESNSQTDYPDTESFTHFYFRLPHENA